MAVIATAYIEGPEARGKASFIRNADNSLTLKIDDYFMAPAPDPYLFLTLRDDKTVDVTVDIDLGKAPTGIDQLILDLPKDLDFDKIEAIVGYCLQYAVYFGSGAIIRS